MKITVKRANSSDPEHGVVTYDVNGKLKLSELRLLIQCDFDIEPREQRLVNGGRLICDAIDRDSWSSEDSMSLSEHGLKDGTILYLVRRAINSHQVESPSSDATAVEKASRSPNMLEGGGASPSIDPSTNPMIEFMMNNPNLIKSMILSDPHMKKMIDQNPQIGHMFSNPEVLRDILRMQTNPNLRKEMTRNQDLAMRNLESVPNAFQEMQKMYHILDKPIQDMQQEASDNLNSKLATSPSLSGASVQKLTSEPLPNPWSPTGSTSSPTSNINLRIPFNISNNNNNVLTSPPNNTSPSSLSSSSTSRYESLYSEQLNQLMEMGYSDKNKNLRALIACAGNVYRAIDYLDQMGNS